MIYRKLHLVYLKVILVCTISEKTRYTMLFLSKLHAIVAITNQITTFSFLFLFLNCYLISYKEKTQDPKYRIAFQQCLNFIFAIAMFYWLSVSTVCAQHIPISKQLAVPELGNLINNFSDLHRTFVGLRSRTYNRS